MREVTTPFEVAEHFWDAARILDSLASSTTGPINDGWMGQGWRVTDVGDTAARLARELAGKNLNPTYEEAAWALEEAQAFITALAALGLAYYPMENGCTFPSEKLDSERVRAAIPVLARLFVAHTLESLENETHKHPQRGGTNA